MNPTSEQKRIAFGYNRGSADQIELHPIQAMAVKLIYQSYVDGQSIAAIAEMLENARIPSPQNKLKWGKQTLANILSNPHYLGDSEYPKIIENEQFDLIQKIKATLAPRSNR